MSKLRRIIAIDNISKNQHIIVNASGHTNLNGENGAGKTVTLRASLLFFGARPGDIAKQKGDTFEGFATFYFPRETSYLVYEYDRAGETLCVVCTGKNGQVHYQFLNTGFNEEFFIIENTDKKFITPSNQLRGKVEQMGFNLSRKVGPEVYAQIIQSNKPYRQKKGAYEIIRQLRPQYSLPTQGGSIRNVDRVLTNIFSSKVSIAHIQSALTDILINDNLITSRILRLDSQSNDIHEWFDARNAWIALEARRDDIEQLVGEAIKHTSLQNSMSALLFHCNQLLDIQGTQIETQTQLIEQNNKIATDASKQRDDLKNTNYDIHHSKMESINALERKSDELIQIKADFEQGAGKNKPIKVLQDMHANLSTYEQKEANANELYNQVSKGVENILAHYDAQRERIKTIKAEFKEKTEALRGKAEKQKYEELTNNSVGFKQKYEGALNLKENKIKALQLQINELQEQSGSIKARLNDESFSAHFKKNIIELEAEIRKADEHYQEALDDKGNASEELESVRAERLKVIERNTQLREQKRAYIDEQTTIKDRLTNGSLFDYLHDNVTGFESTIGKVIKPEILAMKGLDPTFKKGEDSLYGLSINLNGIDNSIELNKSELHAKIAEIDESIVGVEQTIEHNDVAIDGYNKQENTIDSKLARLKIELRSVKDYLTEQRNSLDEEKELASADVKDRHDHLKADLKKCQSELGSINNQIREVSEKYNNQVKLLTEEENVIIQQIEKTHDDTLAQFKLTLDLRLSEQDKAMTSLKIKETKDIAEKGLSPERLEEAKTSLTNARRQTKDATNAGERVSRYEYFMVNKWKENKELTQNIAMQTQEMDTFNLKARQEEETLQKEFDKAVQLVEHSQESITKAIKEKNTANELISELTGMNIEPDPSKPELFKSLAADQCKLKFISLKADHQSNENIGKAYFKNVENTFTQSISTPSRNFYERMRAELIRTHCENDLWWACAIQLHEYMDSGHHTDAQILRENYCLVAKTITDFSTLIKAAHKSLNTLGRKLTATTANVVDRFEAIGRISIHVSSKLTNLSYFSALEDFSAAHEQWFTLHSHELPDDTLINKLTNLVNMLGTSKLEIDVDKSFQFEVRLEDKGSTKVARTDDEIEALSSTGLSYLIITAIYIGLINLLRTDSKIHLHFCVDEIGKLSKINTGKLIGLFNEHNITMFSALPDSSADLLQHYPYAYQIIATSHNSRVYKLYGDSSRVTPENKVINLLSQRLTGE